MRITHADAYQVFDSRGNPTLEAEVLLDDGTRGRGTVPSGASTGQFEALELRDGDAARFRGRSVYRAIDHVRLCIAPRVRGMDATDQAAVDRAMADLDGTPSRTRLGANAILGVSMAVADAAARARRVPLHRHLARGATDLLPLPEVQILGGGAHARWRIDVQDYLLIATGARTYAESLEITFDVYHEAGRLLQERGRLRGVADEGGYWPEFASNEEPLQFLVEAIESAGYRPGRDAALSVDFAASDLYRDGRYRLALEQRSLSSEEMVDLVARWCERYPILSVEDPLADTDWAAWQDLAQRLGRRVQIVGDDAFTTNAERIRRGVQSAIANAVLIKLNQIGTVTETIEAVELTQASGWLPVVSARSGETEDAFITHLAVATGAGQLKVGSFQRGERMAKWNEGLRIARDLGPAAQFLGARIYAKICPESPWLPA